MGAENTFTKWLRSMQKPEGVLELQKQSNYPSSKLQTTLSNYNESPQVVNLGTIGNQVSQFFQDNLLSPKDKSFDAKQQYYNNLIEQANPNLTLSYSGPSFIKKINSNPSNRDRVTNLGPLGNLKLNYQDPFFIKN